jgi:hypothetical protein
VLKHTSKETKDIMSGVAAKTLDLLFLESLPIRKILVCLILRLPELNFQGVKLKTLFVLF